MNLLRPFAGLLLVLTGLSGALSGCLSAPTYDITPSIEFEEMTVVRSTPARPLLPVDTFKIMVNFRDGDGDLGLTQDQVGVSPYTELNSFNFYIRLFRRDLISRQFVEVFPEEYFSNFPPLNSGGEAAPLRGAITYRLPLTLDSPLNPGDEVQFTVSVKDRALNESNTVTTSTYVIPPR